MIDRMMAGAATLIAALLIADMADAPRRSWRIECARMVLRAQDEAKGLR